MIEIQNLCIKYFSKLSNEYFHKIKYRGVKYLQIAHNDQSDGFYQNLIDVADSNENSYNFIDCTRNLVPPYHTKICLHSSQK